MNKNKKIISLVAVIAMIFTMLSSFTFASAAGAGFTLSTPTYNDDGTISVTVGYTGVTNGVADGSFTIEMPSEVTAVKPVTGTTYTYENNILKYSFMLGNSATSATEGTIDTLVLTVSGLTTTKDIAIAEGSYLDANDDTSYEVGDATNNLASPTVTLPLDPNAPTPKPTTDVTPAPVATEPPTDAPEINDPVTATNCFVFGTPSISDDGLTVTVDVNYVGITNGVADGSFTIVMPSEVTAVKPTTGTTYTYENNVLKYSFMLGNSATSETSGKVDTLTLTLSTPFKYDNQLTIADGSYLDANDDTCYEVGKNGVLGSNVVLPAYGETETPKTVGTIALSKAVTVTVNDTPVDGESQYFIIPTVKKGDADAVYGTDYVATIGDTTLTAAQYSNLINGYFDAENVKDIVAANNITSINDVVDQLVYTLYDKTVTVSAQLVNKSTGEIENGDDGTVSVGSDKVTIKKPVLSATVSPSTVYVGSKATVTVKVTSNAKSDGVLTIAATDDSLDYVTGSGIKTAVASDNKSATATFTGAVKGSNAVVIEYSYDYTDENGDAQTITGEKKVTIKEKSDSSSSSSSSNTSGTGSGGIIANGIYGTTGTLTIPGVTFTDLGDAAWAADAIAALASKNIISGRDQYTFDPNANITRAEYCQILIGAIGQDGAYADAQFNDVPTDAWFYHSVAVASQLGIVSGYGDGNFGPYDLITRQDMAVMTMNAVQSVGKALTATSSPSFSDADQVSDYASDSVYTLAQAGIINGMGDGTFAPLNNATRAQAAVIIYATFVQ